MSRFVLLFSLSFLCSEDAGKKKPLDDKDETAPLNLAVIAMDWTGQVVVIAMNFKLP